MAAILDVRSDEIRELPALAWIERNMRSGKVSRGSIKLQVRIRFTCTQVNTMAETTTLTIRVQRGTREALERIARNTRRSKSFIVPEVLATFVQDQGWYAAKIAGWAQIKARQ